MDKQVMGFLWKDGFVWYVIKKEQWQGQTEPYPKGTHAILYWEPDGELSIENVKPSAD